MTHDQYKLDQPSPRGQPGWETFKGKDDLLFYFHFNDEEGKPLLFSQGYQNAKSRDRGLESVKKNAADSSHYAEEKEKDGVYFVIRAGNHQEIARSRVFAGSAKCKKAIAEFQQQLGATLQKKSQSKGITGKPALEKSMEQPSHFRFVLSFYPDKGGNLLRGKIEYPLVKEDKETFVGLDLERIGVFITRHLPGKAMQPPVAPKSIAQGVKLSKPLSFLKEGRPIKGFRLPHEAPVEIQASLSATEKSLHPAGHYRAVVYAKPLKEKQQILIGEKDGELGPDGQVRVPILTQQLKNNVYRFTLYLNLEDPDIPQRSEVMESSQLAQVL